MKVGEIKVEVDTTELDEAIAKAKELIALESSVSQDKKPLLIIEVEDMSSIPTVYFKGEKIVGRIEIKYQWSTTGLAGIGEHSMVIEHALSEDKMVVRREELRRMI